MEEAILGGGCFWCTEAIFQSLRGVSRVQSGYSGGATLDPTYDDICSGETGHAEVVRITFDPAIISFKNLLVVFFHLHDPTTLNRQGADVGSQYRSAVFFLSEAQRSAAQEVITELQQEKLWDGKPFVTEVTPAGTFYPAEGYHQNYYRDNSTQPYCVFVAKPKLDKLMKLFPEMLGLT